jgi:hypothetical protein
VRHPLHDRLELAEGVARDGKTARRQDGKEV